MTKEEICAKLIEFAAESFKEDASAMTADTDITGRNSVKVITMTAMIENEFDVTIAISKFDRYKTISGLADYIIDEM